LNVFLYDNPHGHGQLYKSEDIHPILKRPYGALHQETFSRFQEIHELGYLIFYIWEADFDRLKPKVDGWRDRLITALQFYQPDNFDTTNLHLPMALLEAVLTKEKIKKPL
jgi:hypothetical protein